MKHYEIIFCSPERTTKVGLWLIAIVLVGSIGYLHLLAGPNGAGKSTFVAREI